MLANDARLANYLSRNHQIPHYSESDGERLLMQLRDYMSVRKSGNQEDLDNYLKGLHYKKNVLGTVLQSPESQEYIVSLYELAHHFYSSPCLTGGWMRNNLNDVYGGVSRLLCCAQIVSHSNISQLQIFTIVVVYGIDILKSLFTHLPNFEMLDDDKFNRYCEENDKDNNALTGLMKIGKGCWRLMAVHDEVKNRSWRSEMLDKALMDALDAKFKEVLAVEPEHFLVASETWESLLDDYQHEVEQVFDSFVEEINWADKEQQAVREQLARKLEWITMDHKFHPINGLPLMTKSTIQAIQVVFKRNETAIREVSRLQ
jgi:hypothetical protein